MYRGRDVRFREDTLVPLQLKVCPVLGRGFPKADKRALLAHLEIDSNMLTEWGLDERSGRHNPSINSQHSFPIHPHTAPTTSWISSARLRPRKSSTSPGGEESSRSCSFRSASAGSNQLRQVS